MEKTQEQLVTEEQTILNDLIADMDKALLALDRGLTKSMLEARKAKEACLPEAYGMLIAAEHDKTELKEEKKKLTQGRNELYHNRILMEMEADSEVEEVEMKIGLHTYMDGDRMLIWNWKQDVCRHYLLDNSSVEFDNIVDDARYGRFETHYTLKLRRQIDMFFDKVKKVVQFYPALEEEAEKIIADEFLSELLKRRSSQEFQNIVFSIQKKQGDIIQTPFQQNLIVQGCAGSGKSMIMLHRLPILLYDNPNSLSRNNLYIISPSKTYIQMAKQMRVDLEIEDLRMGTLEQYYDYVIRKYREKPENYGTVNYSRSESQADEKYVYSPECTEEIRRQIAERIEEGQVDYQSAYEILKLKPQLYKQIHSESERIQREATKIQKAIDENERRLNKYYKSVYAVFSSMEELSRALKAVKTVVSREISKKIAEEKKTIDKNQKELRKIKEADHPVMYRNRINGIAAAEIKIQNLNKEFNDMMSDKRFFPALDELSLKIQNLLSAVSYSKLDKERYQTKLSDQYRVISKKNNICKSCRLILQKVSLIDNPYFMYENKYREDSEKIRPLVDELEKIEDDLLPGKYLTELMKASEYYSNLGENLVGEIYLSLMKSFGRKPDQKTKKIDAFSFSPYLYLRILYEMNGAPNKQTESLISIDEAQNIEPEEMDLISAVNGGKAVLNLFGDVNQHAEDSKGINSWKEFDGIASFQTQQMMENYRNARQITEYCNRKFGMNMLAINLDGDGVHELQSREELDFVFSSLFQKPLHMGLCCILVKDSQEAEKIITILGAYHNRVNDMVKESNELKKSKWNLMTVSQAKGLEFSLVFAVSGRMSRNEKYIAYTRALDELYIYDAELKAGNSMSDKKEEKRRKPVQESEMPEAEPVRERKKRKIHAESSED